MIKPAFVPALLLALSLAAPAMAADEKTPPPPQPSKMPSVEPLPVEKKFKPQVEAGMDDCTQFTDAVKVQTCVQGNDKRREARRPKGNDAVQTPGKGDGKKSFSFFGNKTEEAKPAAKPVETGTAKTDALKTNAPKADAPKA